MTLPSREYINYAGVDPGYTGAIARMNKKGTILEVWDMPITQTGKDRTREYDLGNLNIIFRRLRLLPDCVVGLEWPSTRPGEGAERTKRFGVGMGQLEVFCFCKGLETHRIVPQLWKGRLGLDGKTKSGAIQSCAEFFDLYYPEHTELIRGPRGGIKDGRLDALLIAHFMRTRGLGGMKSLVERFGKDSDQVMIAMFSAGSNRKRKKKLFK